MLTWIYTRNPLSTYKPPLFIQEFIIISPISNPLAGNSLCQSINYVYRNPLCLWDSSISLVRAPYSYSDSLEIPSANLLDSIPSPQAYCSVQASWLCGLAVHITYWKRAWKPGRKLHANPYATSAIQKGWMEAGYTRHTGFWRFARGRMSPAWLLAIVIPVLFLCPPSASLLARHHWVIAISCRLFLWLIRYVYRNSSWSLKPMRVRWSRSGLLLLGVRYMWYS